jgi:flavin reductase (DIM6/NTAB) family NADH-FMN oxidoreductase RutF
MKVYPETTSQLDMHQFLLGAVSPRPIAFVSTVDEAGVQNLAPYSFFNAFSSAPPIVVFSSNRRGGDATKKDTLRNIEATMECVINVVSYDIVRQMAVASVDFPSDQSEFTKSGLTPLASERVRAPRVAESSVQMECKVQQIIPLGEAGGAGNLIVCEVVLMHVADQILNGNRIDPEKIDLVGRMGRHYYSRAKGEIFEVVQPYKPVVIGFDALPPSIRNSSVFTGNDLAAFASLTALPSLEEVQQVAQELAQIKFFGKKTDRIKKLHKAAKRQLQHNQNSPENILLAYKTALIGEWI